ncbi:hypothetical protein IFT67_19525 [Sphingomonas sp. CFBP 13728]|uniref:hypothetical protein n=1 Tax=Sphingomonas sp. CFBP 13728 TaxID=2775294 RepID=UPI00177DE1D7|nr:hypothetical protein [Sphingomonas sp. CFBP 13728]MBD8621105.1 hypothetical protein [Sphingomonas sp. CFBP 13728]
MVRIFLALLALPGVSVAQTTVGAPERTRQEATAPGVTLDEAALDDGRSGPPATSTTRSAPMSKNEAYNRARAAKGRMGVRLGNDMSYRVGD